MFATGIQHVINVIFTILLEMCTKWKTQIHKRIYVVPNHLPNQFHIFDFVCFSEIEIIDEDDDDVEYTTLKSIYYKRKKGH